jgi:hypothetical protein
MVQYYVPGVDPKSILCAFFKQGTCGKGEKCKFSHDLTIERKSEKRSLYFDNRDEGTKISIHVANEALAWKSYFIIAKFRKLQL